jgi:hypothetical protein
MSSWIKSKKLRILLVLTTAILTVLLYVSSRPNNVELTMQSTDEVTTAKICPTEANFEEFWNAWSYQYLTDNPDADINMQMEDWNTLVGLNDCGEEWLNPLEEMIKENGASGTPVYWYDTP